MYGFAQALVEDHGPRLDDEALAYARRILAGAARMERLIEDLLAYSRLGQQDFVLSPVRLDRAVRSALDYLQPEFAEDPPTLEIDPGLRRSWPIGRCWSRCCRTCCRTR
jgi:signal transduction histidine kinase